MLIFRNGEQFASGMMVYEYKPIPPDEVNDRIIVRIQIEEIPALAIIDTGAPYLILAPSVAQRLQLDPQDSLDEINLSIRGIKVSGGLFRVRIVFPAKEGNSHAIEATAFVPLAGQEEKWNDLPTFLGIGSCLERIRFALDPIENKFYFGAVP